MHFTIPYIVKSTWLQKGKRTELEGFLRHYVDVVIPDVTTEEAPLVVEFSTAIDRDYPIRHFDEGFWRPLGFSDRTADRRTLPSLVLADRAHWAENWENLAMIYWQNFADDEETYCRNHYRYAFATGDFSGKVADSKRAPITRILTPDDVRAKKEREARQAAEVGTLIIDGVLWSRCDEPRLTIDFPEQDEDGVYLYIETEARKHNGARGQFRDQITHTPYVEPSFRLDAHQDALDYIGERMGERPYELRGCDLAKVKISAPGLLTFDAEADALIRTAQAVLERDQSLLLTSSNAHGQSWLSLLHTVRSTDITSEVDKEKLALRLEAHGPTTDNNISRNDINDALGRWQMRPLDLKLATKTAQAV